MYEMGYNTYVGEVGGEQGSEGGEGALGLGLDVEVGGGEEGGACAWESLPREVRRGESGC
jgi:hypothetical protein